MHLRKLGAPYPPLFRSARANHRPLKGGIFSEIAARGPDLARSDLVTVLNIYTRRMTYLQSLVAGAARVDLDGTPCGEVTAADQVHAAARLTEIQAAREAKRAAAAAGTRTAKMIEVVAIVLGVFCVAIFVAHAVDAYLASL